jgi:hypothetical protein
MTAIYEFMASRSSSAPSPQLEIMVEAGLQSWERATPSPAQQRVELLKDQLEHSPNVTLERAVALASELQEAFSELRLSWGHSPHNCRYPIVSLMCCKRVLATFRPQQVDD